MRQPGWRLIAKFDNHRQGRVRRGGGEPHANAGAVGPGIEGMGLAGLLRQIAGAVRKLKFLNPPRLGGQALSKG